MLHKKQVKKKAVDNSYWKSYSDMMAALLLMFILVMSASLLQSYDKTIQLEEQRAQLNRLLGVKPEIINDLKQELSEFHVEIDEKTGDIKFESQLYVYCLISIWMN